MILPRSRFGLGKGHLGFLICEVTHGVIPSLETGYDNSCKKLVSEGVFLLFVN